ncbi:MAG: MBL fold metallo-hydrolase [Bacteroidales bacterium]|nr:MBL fold metallo-hydrolase [Bacteroidales bacterium]
MNISVLVDNTAGGKTEAEHGLSYLVEFQEKRILFDSGQSNLFMRNAAKMEVDISQPDVIVLSHGHFDHGDGLGYLSGGRMICHPGCFVKRCRKADHSYIGLKDTRETFEAKFDLKTSKEPLKISDGFYFLGEVPRVTDFESKSTSFVFEDNSPDFVMDDSAISMQLDNGIFVVTGCGHSGIVNTLEHAKRVTGENRIYGIMGGFHLKRADIQTAETIKYLKENNVKHVLPSHCTELPALSEFYREFKFNTVKTGNILNF